MMGRIASSLCLVIVLTMLASTALPGATLSWTFKLDPSQLQYQETASGAARMRIEGFSSLEYFDYPPLPYRTVSILLPQGEDIVSCRLEIVDETVIVPGKTLGMFRGSARDDGTTAGVAIARADAETGDGIFPRWLVRQLGSDWYRGYRIANVAYYPVRYDVGSRSLIIEKEARLVVETAAVHPSIGAAERLRYVEGFRKQSLENVERLVINPEAAAGYAFNEVEVDPGLTAYSPSYEPSMEGSEVAYLIVTNDAMAPAFQRLADWKTKKGVPAVVRTIEWIAQHSRAGADLAESVRNYIRDAYAKWGVEWVVIGGDSDVIPARFAYVSFYTGEFIPTDMYYSCLDGTWNADGDSLWGEAYESELNPGDDCDLYAEVYLGRMPASTLAEATVLVDKAINYSTPTDTQSKSKFLMLAEVVFPSDFKPGDDIILDGADVVQSVYELYLAGNPNITATRLFENNTPYPGSLHISRALTLDSLEAGTNQVLHVGHGYKYNMSVGDGSILNFDANSLRNGQKLFSMYLMNCTNVAFDTDCLAEQFLLNSAGGAFAITGSSRSAFPSASQPYLDRYFELMFDQNVVQLGRLQALSRLPFTGNAFSESADRWTHFIYNYLGDPEICIFQGSTKTFSVTKPATAGFGKNNITVTVRSGGVPPDSALVCLYKRGEDYAYLPTNASGVAVFNNFVCETAGLIYVTVTGRNHCQYSDTISVAKQTPAYLMVKGKYIDDVIVGNGDRVLDAGETAKLQIEVKNTGQTAARKLYGILRSSDPAVSFIDSVATYPDLLPGASAYENTSFKFHVSASVPDQHAVEFTIDVHDSTGGLWSDKFAVEVHAPNLELYVTTASDTLPYGNNNGVIEAGEHFLLKIGVKNYGSGDAYGLVGKVRSLDADVAVFDSDAVYSEIPLLGVQYGSGFVISEANRTGINYFTFLLTDAYGRTFSKRMELRQPGQPKTVVLNSTYGPTEMHVTWHRPDSLEAYRYVVFRSDTTGGPYTVANKDLIEFTLFRDTGLLSSTRYYYVIVAVDSCGNEGPWSSEHTATTSPPQLAGWPNRVGKETASSVKIGDVDGDRHPDVVVGSDYVYAWHADGIEVRDGDSQPLTWGIFNTYGNTFTASVALADLDGVIGLEIVGSSWNTKQIFVFKKDGSILPGWPKTTAYLCWASPVVGDIDGDGDLEIITYDVGGTVYAWHHNGVEVRDGDSNPATDGPFFKTKNPGTWHLSTPALADMDEDGVVEMIVCSPMDSIYCLNGNGSRVPGWPQKVLDTNANITASPAVGDIDGDGHLEMVVQSSAARVYGLNHDGTVMTGWPKWVNCSTGTIAPSPALADLDGDGKLEVVVAGIDKKCYIFKYDGTSYPGWPQTYATTGASESSPVIVDIDGDQSLDIILACEEGRLNAWSKSGVPLAGFPIQLGSFLRGTPTVEDLDFDGRLELLTSCWDQNIYAWDLSALYYNGCMQWNGFHGNVYNTGWKEFKPLTAAGQISCVYRLLGDGVELQWSVYPEIPSWNLYRERKGSEFELIASELHADQANLVGFVDGTAEAGLVYRYRLEASGRSDIFQTTEDIMVPVRSVQLYQNHPNPFNPATTIPFTVPGSLASRQNAQLAVYDVNGALVKTLVSGAVAGGRYEVRWDGTNERGEAVASGIYFAQLNAGGHSATRKLVLLR
jgi:hypothetical protein